MSSEWYLVRSENAASIIRANVSTMFPPPPSRCCLVLYFHSEAEERKFLRSVGRTSCQPSYRPWDFSRESRNISVLCISFGLCFMHRHWCKKVKLSRYRPEQAHRRSGRLRPRIFLTFGTRRW
jgi:hypothetical protein